MDREPYAEVQRVGRRSWSVRIVHGIAVYGPMGIGWTVRGGRDRAERKARRELARYLRGLQNDDERFEVRADEPRADEPRLAPGRGTDVFPTVRMAREHVQPSIAADPPRGAAR